MQRISPSSFMSSLRIEDPMRSQNIVVREMIVDAVGCRANLYDLKRLLEVMRQASNSVGATILDEHCTMYEPYGATLALLLAESHLLISTWPEFEHVTANVFLCNQGMDPEQVLDVLFKHLRPTKYETRSFRHVIGDSNGLLGRRVFVAAPFTQHLCPERQVVPPAKRERILSVVDVLRSAGANVFLAHEREHWGEKLMSGSECTGLDFREIQQSEAVVAVLNPPSYGVCLELGWASALQLPIVLLDETGSTNKCTPLLDGLDKVAPCYLAQNTEEVLDALSKCK